MRRKTRQPPVQLSQILSTLTKINDAKRNGLVPQGERLQRIDAAVQEALAMIEQYASHARECITTDVY